MKSRSIRFLSVATAAIMAILPAGAAERLCSVYVESMNALQMQVQKAAEVFDAPELGMFPMMMTMMIPGGSQLNTAEPVSLHIFDVGTGNPAGIIELTPATTAEMFLKALIAASGKPLAPAVNGLYAFDGGAAQVVGTRLLLARSAADLAICTGGAVPALPPMPAVEGTIRVAMAPSAAVPMLDKFKAMQAGKISAAGAKAAEAQEVMDLVMGLYGRTLAQINALEIGISVQQEGLAIRKRLAARSGSTIAGILGSMTPVAPEYLSFASPESLFSVAAGSYTVPASLKRQIVSLYVRMLKMSPAMAEIGAEDLAAMMKHSVALAGAAMAVEGRIAKNGGMLMQGAVGTPDAATYLEEMAALMKMPAYQKMTASSGIQTADPVKRTYKDASVYSWRFTFDEEALRKAVEAQSPGVTLDAKSFGAMKSAMRVLGDEYEYAATSRGLAFGMGSPEMVTHAVDRLTADAPATGEANRIRTLLSPAAAPVVTGRFAIVDAVRLMMKMQCGGAPLPAEILDAPAGEGIVFADWIDNGDLRSATLIPANDVKTLRMMTKAMAASVNAGAGAGEDVMDAQETGAGEMDEGNAADK